MDTPNKDKFDEIVPPMKYPIEIHQKKNFHLVLMKKKNVKNRLNLWDQYRYIEQRLMFQKILHNFLEHSSSNQMEMMML